MPAPPQFTNQMAAATFHRLHNNEGPGEKRVTPMRGRSPGRLFSSSPSPFLENRNVPKQHVDGAGAAVDAPRGSEGHHRGGLAQDHVHGRLEHRTARARTMSLAMD